MKHVSVSVALACVLGAAASASGTERASFDSDGVEIHYTIDGAGPPLLLIHGYTASGNMNWRIPGIVNALATDFRVITMDVRGHGRSEAPEDDGYGMAMVEDVIRLLDQLKLDEVYVAGYSMGGMITNKLLTLYPERVKAAAVCGMGWYTARRSGGDSGDGRERPGPPRYKAMADQFHELETTADEMRSIQTPVTVFVGTEDHGQLMGVERWRQIVPELPVVHIEDANHMNCVFKEQFETELKMYFLEQLKK